MGCNEPEGTNKECERCRLIAEIERLRALASEAIDSIEEWAAYASEYFREKHEIANQMAEFRKRLETETQRRDG